MFKGRFDTYSTGTTAECRAHVDRLRGAVRSNTEAEAAEIEECAKRWKSLREPAETDLETLVPLMEMREREEEKAAAAELADLEIRVRLVREWFDAADAQHIARGEDHWLTVVDARRVAELDARVARAMPKNPDADAPTRPRYEALDAKSARLVRDAARRF